MKSRPSILFYPVVIFLFAFCSSTNSLSIDKQELVNSDYKIEAYKFLNITHFPYSISEEQFWKSKESELASMNIVFKSNTEQDGFLINQIEKMKKIESGLKEDFDYAFITNKTDTVYASLIRNLWTVKKNDEFHYYQDSNGDLSQWLREYSGFFFDCW